MTQTLPGAPPFPREVQARLEKALAERAVVAGPTTDEDESPWTNRLLLESSPYLLQHAHNPVDWHPWGDEAFAEARTRRVPVFLSVGYSTCHWCHVMEAESFDDEEIARLLNSRYVPIKVDREERPDVDAVYMSAVEQLSGRGGWPMSVWLTDERMPFFAGTYFPAHDGERGAPRGLLSLLSELADLYQSDSRRVRLAAEALTQAVREDLQGTGQPGPVQIPGPEVVARAVNDLERIFDPIYGGIRGTTKFPFALPLRLLLRHHRRTGDRRALNMALLTLERMAAGGIHDQLGGGFHRYATDERWLVPHFEKMLYDNAVLALAYTEAHQVTGREDFARVARSTLEYLLREMSTPEGAFASATDADSEGEEGKYFVWTPQELRQLLGDRAERFARAYGVTSAGHLEGASVLHVAAADEEELAALADDRQVLLEIRGRRVPPARDDKIITAWNGLAISALATAGRVLDEARYSLAAARAAEVLLGTMRSGGRIVHSYRAGRHGSPALLEDYALLVAALLDLYETTFDPQWLEEALALAVSQETELADVENGGWFAAPGGARDLIARQKPNHDGAYPSGTSVALLNALRIGAYTDDDRWRLIAEGGFAAIHEVLQTSPLALGEALIAVEFAAAPPRQVAVVWPQGGRDAAEPLLSVLRTTFAPDKVLAAGEEGDGDLDLVRQMVPFIQGKEPVDGRPAAYVCRQGACELPTTDPDILRQGLQVVGSLTTTEGEPASP